MICFTVGRASIYTWKMVYNNLKYFLYLHSETIYTVSMIKSLVKSGTNCPLHFAYHHKNHKHVPYWRNLCGIGNTFLAHMVIFHILHFIYPLSITEFVFGYRTSPLWILSRFRCCSRGCCGWLSALKAKTTAFTSTCCAPGKFK